MSKYFLANIFLCLFVLYAFNCIATPIDTAIDAVVEGDYDTALPIFLDLAEGGDPIANSFLGSMYSNGYGVRQDDKKAVEYYRYAADHGEPMAMHDLGIMYLNGTGVPQDNAQAIFWLRKASVYEQPVTLYTLGQIYFAGQAVEQDYSEAVKWCWAAAKKGHPVAQTQLGYMYAEGLGVEQSYSDAYAWWFVAAEQGNSEAITNLDQIKTILTEQDKYLGQQKVEQILAGDHSTPPKLLASKQPTDKEYSRLLIGKWLCDDPTGKSEFTINDDGTWSEEGTYYFAEGSKEILFSGNWYIERGYYHQVRTKSNVPEHIAHDGKTRLKIVTIDEKKSVMELPNGDLHTHYRD